MDHMIYSLVCRPGTNMFWQSFLSHYGCPYPVLGVGQGSLFPAPSQRHPLCSANVYHYSSGLSCPALPCPDPTRPTRWMHLGLVGVVKRCAYKLRLPALDPQCHVDLGCFSCTMRWMVTGEAIMDYISDRALATQPHSWPSLALLHWGCELTLTGYGANIRGSKNAQTHWATLLKCQTSMRQIFKSLTFGGATFKRPLMFLGLASQSPPVVLT